jgi:predicted metal-dependent RNase
MLPDPRNTIILVGYQSVGTRGRALADGATTLKLFGSKVEVRAEIAAVNEFSVHADSGEADVGTLFQHLITEKLGWESTIPNRNQRYPI